MTIAPPNLTEIPDQHDSIVQMLTAMEYSGSKEEDEIVDKLLVKYPHPRIEQVDLADHLLQKPGFGLCG